MNPLYPSNRLEATALTSIFAEVNGILASFRPIQGLECQVVALEVAGSNPVIRPFSPLLLPMKR